MDYYFSLRTSLGSFYAIKTEELSSEGYAAKLSSINTSDFKWNKLEGFFYTEGQLKDFEINGWTFSYRIEGSHRIYNVANPNMPHFIIQGLDPQGQHFKAKVHSFPFLKEASADFMNMIHFYSKFPDRDIAEAFNTLKYRRDAIDVESRMNNLLPLIQKIHSFYKINTTGNHDAKFYDQIKLELNAAIDDYVRHVNKQRL